MEVDTFSLKLRETQECSEQLLIVCAISVQQPGQDLGNAADRNTRMIGSYLTLSIEPRYAALKDLLIGDTTAASIYSF
jgi:hypothetical protein